MIKGKYLSVPTKYLWRRADSYLQVVLGAIKYNMEDVLGGESLFCLA